MAFEREQARDAFARFVPEAVVDQVLADADGVRLGGVRGEATVMFSDLRGFTSFSETLEPERVIESLNRYLTEMSEAILDHGGTLVAYMGDGIMAVFGAPLKQDDHADRALEAAREMLDRLEGFNGWLREQGLHDGFKMGIGLNSGPVMSGNVGSERRLEYTALGDTTNTAARLEGMTKGTPHQLYLADTTKQRLTRPANDLVAVGEADVRGRKAKVLLWSLSDAPRGARSPEPDAAARTASWRVSRRASARSALIDGWNRYSPPRSVTNRGCGFRKNGGRPWIVILPSVPCGSPIRKSLSAPRPNGSPSSIQSDWMVSNWRQMSAWKQTKIRPRSTPSSSSTPGGSGGP